MNSDDRGKQPESAGWKPMPRTIDLSADEIDPKAEQAVSDPQAENAEGRPHQAADATDPAVDAATDRKTDDEADPEIANRSALEESAQGETEAGGADSPIDRDGETREAPASHGPNPNKRRWRWLAAAAIVLILGAAATYALLPSVWLPILPDYGSAARFAAIEAQIAAIEGNLAATAASRSDGDALSARIAGIDTRLARLESAAAAGLPVPVTPEEWQSHAARLSDAELAILELENRVAALPDPADGTSAETLDELNARTSAVSAEAETFRKQISELQARLDSLAAKFETSFGEAHNRLADAERAAREAAARSLRTAYARGESLLPWLDAIEAYTGPNADLQALREIGAAPSIVALQKGLDEATRQVLSTDTAAEAGIVAGLLHNARKLVRVRPDGPMQGDTLEAILSRVEAALREERLADADVEWRQLPPETQQATAAWHARLATRIAADASLDGLLGRLGTSTSGPDDRS